MSYASGETPLIGDLVEVVDDARSAGSFRKGEVFEVAGVGVEPDYDRPEVHVVIKEKGNSWRERRFRLLARAAGNQRINELNARVAALEAEVAEAKEILDGDFVTDSLKTAATNMKNHCAKHMRRADALDVEKQEALSLMGYKGGNTLIQAATGIVNLNNYHANRQEALTRNHDDLRRRVDEAHKEAKKYLDYFETLMQAVFGCGVFTSEEYTLAKAVEMVKEMKQSDHRRFAIEALSQAGFKEGVLVERIHRCIAELEDARLRASEAAGDAAARIENRDAVKTLQNRSFRGSNLNVLLDNAMRHMDSMTHRVEELNDQANAVRVVLSDNGYDMTQLTIEEGVTTAMVDLLRAKDRANDAAKEAAARIELTNIERQFKGAKMFVNSASASVSVAIGNLRYWIERAEERGRRLDDIRHAAKE
jgi:hypothetical protein